MDLFDYMREQNMEKVGTLFAWESRKNKIPFNFVNLVTFSPCQPTRSRIT